jgi:hypothetical protein
MSLKRIGRRGLVDAKERDPRDSTLNEWQQAKRIAHHAGETG